MDCDENDNNYMEMIQVINTRSFSATDPKAVVVDEAVIRPNMVFP